MFKTREDAINYAENLKNNEEETFSQLQQEHPDIRAIPVDRSILLESEIEKGEGDRVNNIIGRYDYRFDPITQTFYGFD